ncbi:MAG: acyl-[acyl-carrier-protein] thioesterase [Alkalispirochaetaceae bacterium]
MKSVWTTEFRVRSYESDRTGTLKPHSLLNYFEEVAQQHATELGFGYEQLKEQQQFWVLSRLEAVVDRSPRWGEKVTVETWPKSVSRLFAIRDFFIHDGQEESGEGQPLVRATSAWLLMDARAGRPLRPEKFLPQGPLLHNAEKSAVSEIPGKISLEESEPRLATTVDVQYSDLDVNDHVNNSVYLRWIDDAVRRESQDRELHRLELNFLKEASIPMSVDIVRSGRNPVTLECRSSEGEALMRGILQYRE